MLVLDSLLQNIKAFLNELKIGRTFAYIGIDSLNNCLDNMNQFVI